MKFLITGAKGQLGTDITEELARRSVEFTGADIADFDITDRDAAFAFIAACKPDVVIHCAAYTAVDKAEDEPELCKKLNGDGTRNIAEACKENGAAMLYVSTDYVLPGTGTDFYGTDAPTDAASVYGRTKLAGEKAVQEILEKFFIVRISWIYGKNGNNFVKTMLRLGKERETLNVVCDQIGSPTCTADLAPLLCDIAASGKYGVYHATNEGVCSWAEFTEEIFRLAGYTAKVNPIPASEYPAKAVRPYNSRLDKSCLDENGFKRLPHWKDALERFMKAYGTGAE